MIKQLDLFKILKNFIVGVIPAGLIPFLDLGNIGQTLGIGCGVALLGLIEFWLRNRTKEE